MAADEKIYLLPFDQMHDGTSSTQTVASSTLADRRWRIALVSIDDSLRKGKRVPRLGHLRPCPFVCHTGWLESHAPLESHRCRTRHAVIDTIDRDCAESVLLRPAAERNLPPGDVGVRGTGVLSVGDHGCEVRITGSAARYVAPNPGDPRPKRYDAACRHVGIVLPPDRGGFGCAAKNTIDSQTSVELCQELPIAAADSAACSELI